MQQSKPQRQHKSIIYVNYSPYENSGKILDFLLDNFENVYLFSLGFYVLRNKKKYNKLLIYRKGSLKKELNLLQIPMPVKLFFLLLPLRSIITLAQIVFYSLWLKNKNGDIEFYFTVNAFAAWIGTLLKGMKIVNKTIFWVWDYYPPIHDNKIITIMRHIYWYFDKISSHSDYVAYVNQRLIDLRKEVGVLKKDAKFPVIPIGTEKFNVKLEQKKNVIFGFIGVIKKSHGLDLIFDNADKIMKNFPKASLEVIGSGPDETYFKKRAEESLLSTEFHGYLPGDTFIPILKKSAIGIATYVPDESNVSYYGDPGKVKLYISLGIPVIVTDVVKFSEEIDLSKAGIAIAYNDSEQFINGIKKIMVDYQAYQKNALELSKKYYYKNIYRPMFGI